MITNKGEFLYSTVSNPENRPRRVTLYTMAGQFNRTPLSIARYSFTQLSELEQCRVKKLAIGFNMYTHARTHVLARAHTHTS